MTDKTIGSTIAKWRTTAGMTQQELADKCGVHRNTISNIETCKVLTVKSSILQTIANALGASLQDLVEMREPQVFRISYKNCDYEWSTY